MSPRVPPTSAPTLRAWLVARLKARSTARPLRRPALQQARPCEVRMRDFAGSVLPTEPALVQALKTTPSATFSAPRPRGQATLGEVIRPRQWRRGAAERERPTHPFSIAAAAAPSMSPRDRALPRASPHPIPMHAAVVPGPTHLAHTTLLSFPGPIDPPVLACAGALR